MSKQEYLINAYNTLRLKGVVRTQKGFAELLGIDVASMSKAMNGNESYLTDKFIGKVEEVLDKVELDDMFPSVSGTRKAERVATLPVIPTDAMAGTLNDFTASIADYDCERMVSPIKGADYAMKVCGDSMSPEYPNGCQILIKKINEKAFIEWGKVYVLDTENGAVIKQIRKTANENEVECVSLNSSYQSFTIDTSYINGWYRVLMVLSLK